MNHSSAKVVDIENAISSDSNTSKLNTNESSIIKHNKPENHSATSNLIKAYSDYDQSSKLNPTLSNSDKPKSEGINSLNTNSSFRNKDVIFIPNIKESNSVESSSESTKSTTTTPLSIKPIPTFLNNKDQNNFNLIEQLPLLEILSLICETEIPSIHVVPKLGDFKPDQKELISDIKNYYFSSSIGKVGLVNRSTNALTNAQDHVEELRLNEKTIDSRFLASTDFTVGYQLKSGWTLESGLEYNRVVEFFNFEDTLSIENIDVEYEKALYFLDQNLDTLFFSDSVTLESSDIRKVSHNNYHSYVNIPLRLGYRYTFGNANVFSSVGISYAFTHNFRGREVQLLDSDDKVVVDNPSYNLKNRFGFHLGLGVEYPVSQRTYIFTKMAYQRSPKLSKDALEKLYQSYSLGVGLKVFLD